MSIDLIFSVVILIFSVVIHEVSHGYAAYSLGDNTAKFAGRLTLNPIHHLDPIGSLLIPLATSLFGGFIFGWARPVPYNPYNLSNQRWGPAYVALAGPASNIAIALIFGMLVRFSSIIGIPEAFIQALVLVVFINLILAFFNLIPIPPLDGSKILFAFLPPRWMHIQEVLEQYGFMLVIFFIFALWRFFIPMVFSLFSIITGAHLGAF